MEPLAEEGNSKAMYILGQMYMNGDGVQHSDEMTKKWWGKASSAGNLGATVSLANLLIASGNTEEKRKGVLLLEEAADFDDASVQFDVGVQYMMGTNVKQNFSKAFEYFQKSSLNGNEDAKCILSYFYQHGLGVSKNAIEASKLMNDLKKSNCGEGEFRIGQYSHLNKDYSEAIKWFTKSILNGNPHAITNLGCMYLYGQGLEMDKSKARDLFHQAAKKGCKTAEQYLRNWSSLKTANPPDDILLD